MACIMCIRDGVWSNERFCVAIGNFRLQHSWPDWEEFLLGPNIFKSRQGWPK